MTVLLTGGAGFIGSHVALNLLRKGYDAVIVDDLSNSCRSVIERLEKVSGRKCRFYCMDAGDKVQLSQVFHENKIDAVIHFAGYKAVGESVRQPLKYFRNNLASAITTLECMVENNVDLFVFSSSATVYGTCQEMPLTEKSPLGVTSPYGRTKLMIEEICRDLCAAHSGFKAVMLRYFNPIGADDSLEIGENPNGIPNNLMPYLCKVATGELEKLTIFGKDYPTPDGTCIRDYIDITDLALGHIAALESRDRIDAGFSVFNLGTGKGVSVTEIVTAFNKVNGDKVRFVYGERRSGDVAVSYADNRKAVEVLGWKPETTLEHSCRNSFLYSLKNSSMVKEKKN